MGWDVLSVTGIEWPFPVTGRMILALPGHGWDILPVTMMGHSIPVMDRASQP